MKKIGKKTIYNNILAEKTDPGTDDRLYNEDDIKTIFKRCNPADSDFILNLDSIEQTEIPDYRNRFAIPAPPPPPPIKKYGGWARANPWERRIDFYVSYNENGNPGTEQPLVYRMLTSLCCMHEEKIASQLINLKNTLWGVDPGFTLATAFREARYNMFSDIESTFDQGGLDNFHKEYPSLERKKFLPDDFPPPEKTPGTTLNENHVEVFPAKLQKDRQIEAYGAFLNKCFIIFVRDALEIYGICTEIIHEINTLSLKARRIWNGIYFMGWGRGRKILQKFYDENLNLDQISTNKIEIAAQNHDNSRRALVSAAEAEFLDNTLTPPFGGFFPPPTKVRLDYKWETLV